MIIRGKRRSPILIGIVAVIALCCGVSLIGAALNPNRSTPRSASLTGTAVPATAVVAALVSQPKAVEPTAIVIAAPPTSVPEVPAPTATAEALPTAAPLPTDTPSAPPEAVPSAPQQASISPQGDSVNVRSGPGTEYGLVTALASGQSATVIGRNAAGDWLQIEQGWVNVGVVNVTGDASQAQVVQVEAPVVEQAVAPTVAVVDVGAAPAEGVVPAVAEVPATVPVQAVSFSPASVEPTGKDSQGEFVDPPWLPCAQGQIKGSQNRKYHVPDGRYYAHTFRDVTCFNSANEAEAAGFQYAKNQ